MTISTTELIRYQDIHALVYRAITETGPGSDLLYIRKFGKTQGISSGVTEDLWSTGGARVLPETTAATVSLVSTSANDTLGGTGANYAKISGLDENYNHQSEIIALSGLTPVTSVNTYITINRALASFCGTGQVNAGSITGTINGNTHFTIPANDSITQQSHFTIPDGYTAFTVDVTLSVFRTSGSGARRGEVVQMAHSPPANTTYRSITYGLSNDGGIYTASPTILSQTPARSTLWFECTPDANNTAFTSSVSYLLVKNDLNIIDF